ncbi:MAG: hypothetical protein GF346_11330 [Candidatus Eisenbacteria bacterium]|nr:hypothetical protein [Candidatus Latescibacterota bacterium]MBD3303027.1 hypothetical protein [Candidatus Eisenbacteria bacterium]
MKRAYGILAAAALILLPVQASALVELDLGFEPAEVCPGDDAQFFFSLENVGDQEEMVALSVTVSFGDYVIGPLEGQVPLAAGEEVAREFGMRVPPPAPPGVLRIDVSATDSDGIVEAAAELEILECLGPGVAPEKGAKNLLNQIQKSFRDLGVR